MAEWKVIPAHRGGVGQVLAQLSNRAAGEAARSAQAPAGLATRQEGTNQRTETDSRQRTSLSQRAQSRVPGRPAWSTGTRYRAPFIRAIDGDTIIVAWSPEDETDTFPDRIRLAGIDAPEFIPRPQPGAAAAQLHL